MIIKINSSIEGALELDGGSYTVTLTIFQKDKELSVNILRSDLMAAIIAFDYTAHKDHLENDENS